MYHLLHMLLMISWAHVILHVGKIYPLGNLGCLKMLSKDNIRLRYVALLNARKLYLYIYN